MSAEQREIARLQRQVRDWKARAKREAARADNLATEVRQWRGWEPGVWNEVLTLTDLSPQMQVVLRMAKVANLRIEVHQRDGKVVLAAARRSA